jgi:hypothetical protein
VSLELTRTASHTTKGTGQRGPNTGGRPPAGPGGVIREGYGARVITVVTPIAAQSFDPHATPAMGEGTYFSFAADTESEFTVASHGEAPFVPPTTQRFSVEQASVKIELRSAATFDHFFPKLSVRTIRQPVESFASPRHWEPAQFSDVSDDHVSVETSDRAIQVMPPSVLT